MSINLRAFLVLPSNIIIYSLKNDQSEKFIYNAGSLQRIDPSMEVTGFIEIAGSVTDKFGVHPVILGYDNDKLEVVYATQQIPYIFTSDGLPAKSDQGMVIVRANVLIPDLEKSTISREVENLVSMDLQKINEEVLLNYINLSKEGKPQDTTKSYFDLLKTQTKKDTPSEKFLGLYIDVSGKNPTAQRSARSPSPRMIPEKIINEDSQLDLKECIRKIENLTAKLQDAEDIIKIMNQRLYQMYPIDCPNKLRIDGKSIPVISVDEIKKKMSANEIERFSMNPVLQGYAGSHRSNNRMLTFYAKNGDVYLVRADYDVKTNKINPPK